MARFDDVIRLNAHLPEVTVSTSYSTPALKVLKKGFCRLWGDRDCSKADVGDDEVLVVSCDPDEKEFLLAESDGSIFTAPHYDGHGAVLNLLDDIDPESLSTCYLRVVSCAHRSQFSVSSDPIDFAMSRCDSIRFECRGPNEHRSESVHHGDRRVVHCIDVGHHSDAHELQLE
ncbi:MAG TPA: MmcQ/YjbR family DNA-binding protein [Acidimicrobiales bacterium]|nr:MmcQ/YjbR family DNA-binding protein [Acidimicrobiales bacterium]